MEGLSEIVIHGESQSGYRQGTDNISSFLDEIFANQRPNSESKRLQTRPQPVRLGLTLPILLLFGDTFDQENWLGVLTGSSGGSSQSVVCGYCPTTILSILISIIDIFKRRKIDGSNFRENTILNSRLGKRRVGKKACGNIGLYGHL